MTPFRYLTLVFAGLYNAALFGVVSDAVGWAGAGLVVAGAGLLAWREGRLHRPATAPAPFQPAASQPPAPQPPGSQDLRR